MQDTLKYNWTLDEIKSIYNRPLLELVFDAASVHRRYQAKNEVQVCTLLSVKTGGCSEDCSYCSQSVHNSTGVDVHPLLDVDTVMDAARKAKEAGSTRFCMGAAWREVRDNRDFEKVIEMVSEVNDLGLEVCCTLGMLNEDQAQRLKEAGLHAYNHNLDTSESFYDQIITTRTYEDRLETLRNVRKAGLTICSGGILGLGEKNDDRIEMLQSLATLNPHPESVPINALVAVEGTPLAGQQPVPLWDMVRTIATARILMPTSMVRLSAGRMQMSQEGQALCFLAGANSIFAGEKLLTTPNPERNEDDELFEILGLKARPSFKEAEEFDVPMT